MIPSVKWWAKLFEKDILIFCIDQLMGPIFAARKMTRHLRLTAYDLTVATNHGTGGDADVYLHAPFVRLAGTRITTNLVNGSVKTNSGFDLIESGQILRVTWGRRMMQVSVTLSEWLFRTVRSKSMLTPSRNYFRLRKPLERRVYELARKRCGRQ